MRLRTFAALSAAALVCAAANARPAAAQDTVVAPGPHYRAGGLVRFVNGEEYRAEWTTPVRVPVLDPERFAGGLTVLQAGGGFATESLRMLGEDGRQYVFRSVDKSAARGVPEDLQGSFVQWIVQDLTSAKHPGAAHVVPPLLEAVGVLHVVPALYVMPNHPFLGEFRERFAGTLGQVEERPEEEGDEGVERSFAGADRVVGTERLFERLEADPAERVASREFLGARLVDLVVGDWDRHMDQWRWAGFESDDDRILWRPIPRDRDNAFSDYEGLFPATARFISPQLTRYGPRWRDLAGYFHLATPLDRRLLTELDRPAWDSVTALVRARLTDEVISSAVRAMPAEWQPLGADGLAAAMRARRDRLNQASTALYLRLASDVDVRASDEDDVADVTRHPDGSVEVVLREADGGAPYFRRRFVPAETREVRVHLHGGDDRAVIRGTAPRSIQVRLVGGAGDDVLADSSTARRGMSVLHDDRGDNVLHPGQAGRVDTGSWKPVPPRTLFGNPPPPRDWGADFNPVTPWGGWVSNVGPVIGAGPVWTRYGFRRQPYARQTGIRVLYAPLEDGLGVEGFADFVRTGRPAGLRLNAGARTFDVVRFHGLGNDSPGSISEEYEVTSSELRAEAAWYGRMGRRGAWSAGPMARWLDPRSPAFTTVPAPRGADGFAQAGAAGALHWDGRDTLPVTRSGWWLGGGARAFGTDAGGPFGGLRGEGRTYLSLGGGPVLALRAGGEVVRGDFPFAEAAFLGGGGSLRGYPTQRFAGDASAFGSVELRQPLGQVRLLVRGRLGVFALADAGRVWLDGDSPGGWHTDYGAGLWFETLGIPLTLTWARGDVHRLYVGMGMPF